MLAFLISTVVSRRIGVKTLLPQPIPARYVFFCFAMCAFIYPVVVAWTWSCSGWLNYVGAGCAALFLLNPYLRSSSRHPELDTL